MAAKWNRRLTRQENILGWKIQCDQMSLLKNRPKCCPTQFCQTLYITFAVEKEAQKLGVHLHFS
jgi:hypothetical protein